MNDYKELIEELNGLVKNTRGYSLPVDFFVALAKAADAIEQLVRERDAAVDEIARCCRTCKHGCIPCGKLCRNDSDFGNGYDPDLWEWRGVSE